MPNDSAKRTKLAKKYTAALEHEHACNSQMVESVCNKFSIILAISPSKNKSLLTVFHNEMIHLMRFDMNFDTFDGFHKGYS